MTLNLSKYFEWAPIVAIVLAGVFAAAGLAQAQQQFQTVQAQVTTADAEAAAHVSNVRIHVLIRNQAKLAGIPAALTLAPGALDMRLGNVAPQATPELLSVPETPTLFFFPGGVSKGGGTTVVSAKHHSIFVNCPAQNCWGANPNLFLSNLGLSTFVHVLDQYAGSAANGRYTVGTSVNATYPIYSPAANTLSQDDILQIVHASAVATGKLTGYGHIYHVFLPKGVDTCFDPSLGGGCYSPDNFSTFVFCGYHESVTFKDIGHVLYTVEPFEGPISSTNQGCSLPPGTPNGQFTDSTSNVLSHEVFETISDPDPPTGFTVQLGPLAGMEIGDVCHGPFANISLNGHSYAIQLEDSNLDEACVNQN
jgi:hypothetical protein